MNVQPHRCFYSPQFIIEEIEYDALERIMKQNLLKVTMITSICSIILLEFYIHYRQYCLLKNSVKKPEELYFVSDEKYRKARQYFMEHVYYLILKKFWQAVFLLLHIYYDLFYEYWKFASFMFPTSSKIVVCFIWQIVIAFVQIIFDIILELYETLTTTNTFIGTAIHVIFVTTFINSLHTEFCKFIVAIVLYDVIRFSKKYSLILIMLLSMFIDISLSIIIPYVITSDTELYERLPDTELKIMLEEVLHLFNFPIDKLYVQKNSTNINASFSGIFFMKQIIISESLIKSDLLSTKEILSIIIHELGHFCAGDVTKLFIISTFSQFIKLLLLLQIYSSEFLFNAFGFSDDSYPIYIGISLTLYYVLLPLNLLLKFLSNIVRRHLEYEADMFVKEIGLGDALKSTFLKTSEQRFICYIYDKWYSVLKLNHPSLLERLKNVE